MIIRRGTAQRLGLRKPNRLFAMTWHPDFLNRLSRTARLMTVEELKACTEAFKADPSAFKLGDHGRNW